MKVAITYLKNLKAKCFALSVICVLFLNVMVAQDIHFSNWSMSPLNLNPANAGLFEGDGRLIFNYRNQWKSVPVPYSTFSFGADFNLKKSLVNLNGAENKKVSEAVGIIFNHDAAGDGKYTINEVKIPINHKFSFKKDSGLTLSLGVLAGLTNISIDPNRLSYDRQWDGDSYNQSLGNGENFVKQSKLFGDVSLGTVIQKRVNHKIKVTAGYAISHINRPNISFNNTPGAILRVRHNESLQLKYSLNNISSIMLEYYANQQQKFRENLVGLSYHYTIDPKTNTVMNVGILARLGDALIATVGLKYNTMRLQVSYDYNYSQFKRATNGRGGFEISFIYIWAKAKVFIPKSRVCPIYM